MSRTNDRRGTKTKVLPARRGNKGPFAKSRFARIWKKDGGFGRTETNPKFVGAT